MDRVLSALAIRGIVTKNQRAMLRAAQSSGAFNFQPNNLGGSHDATSCVVVVRTDRSDGYTSAG